ncbi:hypothetical protein N8Z69_03060 [Candidatus Thioglobus sp.]|nr:hypothetical protein [Candidatus Thioglobus sp.]
MTLNDDKNFYLIAYKEWDDLNRDEALYAKLITINKGDEEKTKFDYIKTRVDEIKNKIEKKAEKKAEILAKKEAEILAKEEAEVARIESEKIAEIARIIEETEARALTDRKEAQRLARIRDEKEDDYEVDEKAIAKAVKKTKLPNF